MADSFVIKSVKTDAVLEFSHLRRYYVKVALLSKNRKAVTDVYLDEGDTLVLANLFRDMAEQWRGWEGKLSWTPLETEFTLDASSDGLGHVELEVEFSDYSGAEPWHFKGSLLTEAGQLDAIAKEAERFFVDNAAQVRKK